MKYLLACLLMIVTVNGNLYCQESALTSQALITNENVRYNELKLNALLFILGLGELEYERFLDEDSSLGIHVSFPLFIDSESEPISTDLNFSFTPYYRVYFGKKFAAGFFFEGFAMLNSNNRRLKEPSSEQVREDVTDFAIGFGLGGKWILKNKYVFELSWGIGRNLFNTSEYDDAAIVGRGGLLVAYRF